MPGAMCIGKGLEDTWNILKREGDAHTDVRAMALRILDYRDVVVAPIRSAIQKDEGVA